MVDAIGGVETREFRLATAARKPSKSFFIVHLLSPLSHNKQHFRVGSELCPGTRGADFPPTNLVWCGHASLLRIRLARLAADFGAESISDKCSTNDADCAAELGYLDVIRELRAYGVHCTVDGADMAASNGHLEVVQELRAHGVEGSPGCANPAAKNGHLEMIRDLRAHGIHCTSHGADWAAYGGHLEVIRDLRAHDIHCTFQGAGLAARKGHEDVVRDLEAHGITPKR